MNNKDVLFKIAAIDRSLLPYYYDFGKVVSQIQEKLQEETGVVFQMYSDEDTSNEIWDILDEDLKEESPEVRLVCHVYQESETKTISSNHTDQALEFTIKPRISNGLYYYPHYQVALARTLIFQSDGEMTRMMLVWLHSCNMF